MNALLNPWVIVGGMAALIAAFFFGVYMEHGRFMGFVAKVEAAGEAAAKESAQRIATDKKLRETTDAAHKRQMVQLLAANSSLQRGLRDARARSSIVPAATSPAADGTGRADGSSGRVCFDREKLHAGVDRSLERFEQRLGALVQRSAGSLILLNTCAGWAKQIAASAPRADVPLRMAYALGGIR